MMLSKMEPAIRVIVEDSIEMGKTAEDAVKSSFLTCFNSSG